MSKKRNRMCVGRCLHTVPWSSRCSGLTFDSTWLRGRSAATIAGLVRALRYFGRGRNLSAPSMSLLRMRLREPRESRERTRPRHPATRPWLRFAVGIYRPYQFSVDRIRDCLCRSFTANYHFLNVRLLKELTNITLCVKWTVHYIRVDFQQKCCVGFVRVLVTASRRRDRRGSFDSREVNTSC